MNRTIARCLTEGVRASGWTLGLSVGIAATLIQAPLTALGQTAVTAATAGGLDEIIVTANKLNTQKVLDTPSSIQAISGDALRLAGDSQFMDIAGEIPGLSVQDLGPGDKKYVIRGINSTGDSTIGLYYGEAVISGSNANDGGGFTSDIRLYDLDRIEVLRGPQGTLYGASSMSGTIRFIPKAPDLNSMGGYLIRRGLEYLQIRRRQLQRQRRRQFAHHRWRPGIAFGGMGGQGQRLYRSGPGRYRRLDQRRQ